MSKVGIFSGSFDPVHKGHIALALEAIKSSGLDKVYFLPDVVPYHKAGVTHYAHRVAMLKLALRPYRSLHVLEMTDKQFTVARTLPKLRHKFTGDELHLLIGTDVLEQLYIKAWPNQEKLLEAMTLIVGIRSESFRPRARMLLDHLQPKGSIIETDRLAASSRAIRDSLAAGTDHAELLESIKSYISENWLYVSVANRS
jgi:nicotinate-nucleotide adenylyltransferase